MLPNFARTVARVIRLRLLNTKRRVTSASAKPGLKEKIASWMLTSVRGVFVVMEVGVRICLEGSSVFVRKTISVLSAMTTDQSSYRPDLKPTVTPTPTANNETSTQNATQPSENAIAHPGSPENCATPANKATKETCAIKT